MSENAQKPRIRFKGFSDAWEQRKLGDLFNYYRPDNYIVKSDKYVENAPTPVLTANKGFILGYTNENRSFSQPCIIFDDFTLDSKFVDFPFMVKSSAMKILVLKDEKIDDLIFCYELLNSTKIEVLGHARHYISVVQPTAINIPRYEEQRRISELFQQISNLITLHQRKYDKLVAVKKSLLEKMFPADGETVPKIRFKGFSDAWEQRKLGELALFNPKDALPQTFEYVDLESVVGTEMLSHRTEVKSSAPSRAQRLAHTGDLFYQTVRPYQKNNYLFEKPDNNYVFSTGYAQMRPYADGYFLLSLVQSEHFVKVVLDNCTGTSYPAINANDLAEIEVTAPSDESEAQKIGTIFRSIDNIITLHQRQLEKLKNIKSALLEKMFV